MQAISATEENRLMQNIPALQTRAYPKRKKLLCPLVYRQSGKGSFLFSVQ